MALVFGHQHLIKTQTSFLDYSKRAARIILGVGPRSRSLLLFPARQTGFSSISRHTLQQMLNNSQKNAWKNT